MVKESGVFKYNIYNHLTSEQLFGIYFFHTCSIGEYSRNLLKISWDYSWEFAKNTFLFFPYTTNDIILEKKKEKITAIDTQNIMKMFYKKICIM